VTPTLLWRSWRWMTVSGTPSWGHLDGMCVTQLMGCKAAPHAGGRGSASQVGAHGCR